MLSPLESDSRSADEIGRALSNLALRPFWFHRREYASMEGFLQSVKFDGSHEEERLTVSAMYGTRAFFYGQRGNDWKTSQLLYLPALGFIDRHSTHRQHVPYAEVLDAVYDAQYVQCSALRSALLASVGQQLIHTRGKNDPTDTVLTQREYIQQLERLRFRVLAEIEG